MAPTRRKTLSVQSSQTPPGEWVVPAHLQGLSCIICGYPFKDGDTHGQMEEQTDGTLALICRTEVQVKDPAQVVRLEGETKE